MVSAYTQSPVWKKAHGLGAHVYRLTQYFPRERERELVEQIRSDSQNITFHLERGFSESGLTDYLSCYKESYRAAVDLRRAMNISRYLGYVGDNVYEVLLREIEDILTLIRREIRHLDHLNTALNADIAYNYTWIRW